MQEKPLSKGGLAAVPMKDHRKTQPGPWLVLKDFSLTDFAETTEKWTMMILNLYVIRDLE